MLGRLPALVVAVPLLDILLLIAIGKKIGYPEIIFIVIGVGIIGIIIAVKEGFIVLREVKDEFYKGNLPTSELMDGLLVLIGAAMFIMPGLISDIIGLLCLIPKSKSYMKKTAYKYFRYLLNYHLYRDRLRR
jgi:UPF0716 protein FxsA